MSETQVYLVVGAWLLIVGVLHAICPTAALVAMVVTGWNLGGRMCNLHKEVSR